MDEKTIELIKAAQGGNRYALAQLLHESYTAVYRYLLKLTLNEYEAQDIAQDAMVKAIEKINIYNYEKSSFSTWMITIAKNLFIDRVRKQKLFDKYAIENLHIEQHSTPLEDFLEKDEIISFLSKLSPKLRAPIVLKYGFDFSYEEIAKYLKIPIGTVKSRISNGIKAMRKEMGFYE
ncbi:sigma-70 family RNA polymerase sigma factor [Proteiniborus sp. MB09-C3]|uniref:sigma-70 family RNA polymerase sigma factor n=1 Tax=Proteiniborus sp. MB09-C3 TaxID=3050072 RepID=UPI00255444FF|nr:sigma-70 family RNA polymerase sigma factor [Proteiniborus sp. MB09-C3]WIV13822.1 sigma-70 family RNA polymerase sigma factor [Proteiniborus sp. MB09-C3]